MQSYIGAENVTCKPWSSIFIGFGFVRFSNDDRVIFVRFFVTYFWECFIRPTYTSSAEFSRIKIVKQYMLQYAPTTCNKKGPFNIK